MPALSVGRAPVSARGGRLRGGGRGLGIGHRRGGTASHADGGQLDVVAVLIHKADQQRLRDIVVALKGSGIKTSIDDFGVGYSSMSMLRDIPFNEIKIDRSFLITDADSEVFLRKMVVMKHIISLSSELGMTCIAAGAETVDQVDLLFKNGCTRVQGYFFDKPLPVRDFCARLENPRYTQEHSGNRKRKRQA